MSVTVQELLTGARQQLSSLSASAQLDAELLLARVMQESRTWLHTWPDKPVSREQQHQFERLLTRRVQGEPIAHILGQQEFWSLPLEVTPATLIPRPDTERLVELALERIPEQVGWLILDPGTGSGAIALALASERPACQILAVDRFPAALRVAQRNAGQLGLNNVGFVQMDWLQGLKPRSRFEMIVSNPPYVCEDDPHLGQGDVRFEPRTALAAGSDGLEDIRRIARQAWFHLTAGGWLLLEHGYDQAEAVSALLDQAGYTEIADFRDYTGNPRVAIARLPK